MKPRPISLFSKHAYLLHYVANHPKADAAAIADAIGVDQQEAERLVAELIAADVLIAEPGRYSIRSSAELDPGVTVAELVKRVERSSRAKRSTRAARRTRSHRARRDLFGLV